MSGLRAISVTRSGQVMRLVAWSADLHARRGGSRLGSGCQSSDNARRSRGRPDYNLRTPALLSPALCRPMKTAEVRDQRSEGRGHRSEIRGQREGKLQIPNPKLQKSSK